MVAVMRRSALNSNRVKQTPSFLLNFELNIGHFAFHATYEQPKCESTSKLRSMSANATFAIKYCSEEPYFCKINKEKLNNSNYLT